MRKHHYDRPTGYRCQAGSDIRRIKALSPVAAVIALSNAEGLPYLDRPSRNWVVEESDLPVVPRHPLSIDLEELFGGGLEVALEALGAEIRWLRTNLGLSQTALGALAGHTQSSISNIELAAGCVELGMVLQVYRAVLDA